MSSRESELVFNGVNATTGRPLVPALSPETIVRLACGEKWDLDHLADLKERNERIKEDDMDVAFGVDPRELAETGWGVIFPHDTPEPIREALKPLLKHRRAEATQIDERYYKELIYRPGESKPKFLARHGVGPGPIDPEQLPYYLLIVGGPAEIPFSFQYQLDVQYAAGRICFEKPEDYQRYAQSVVTAETNPRKRPRRMALVGTAHPDDRATQLSSQHLVQPLAQALARRWGGGSKDLLPGEAPWTFEPLLAEQATKANFGELLGGAATPPVFFCACHGIGFEDGDPRQLAHQGALLCQDWPGLRRWPLPIPSEHYFAADDVSAQSDLSGVIAFFFSCYGAGTPRFDEFAHQTSSRRQIAPESFVAQLPQRLLARPVHGALAVVGHVDRAWGYSFDWPQSPRQMSVFTSAFGRLFDGFPVGAAMEYFNQRYAELSSDLSVEVENVKYGLQPDLMTLGGMWTANNDARSYVVLGDPAVRLAV